MKYILIATMTTACLLTAACADTGAAYNPIPDGPVSASYAPDLEQCRQLAARRAYLNGDTRTDALVGAGVGGLVGLADDEVSDVEGALAGAMVGAVAGAGAGMLETRDERRDIVVQCMRGRGHRVVG